jgi:hypothetical protein
MVSCNLCCDMALQCNIGEVQTAGCMMHYALLQRSNGDLRFCAVQVTRQCTALQHWWLSICTFEIIFCGISVPQSYVFRNKIWINFLSPFCGRIQSFPTIHWCGGNILDILEDSLLKKQGTKVKTTQFLRIHYTEYNQISCWIYRNPTSPQPVSI